MADGDTDTALQSSTGESVAPFATPPADDKAPTKPKKGKALVPETSQAGATAPRPIDPETGLELDEHGLPTSRIARAVWLEGRGIDDPALKEVPEPESNDGR